MKVLGMDFGCATGSLRDGKFPDKDCLLPLISKLLGYAIVAASTTVKVPQVGGFLHSKSFVFFIIVFGYNLFNYLLKFQILKILKNKSVRGLSVVGFELEVVGYTIALAYCLHKGLPFSAYGELAFLLIQGACYTLLSLF
jgi:mannose-P-dolichol utilization defect protein 1